MRLQHLARSAVVTLFATAFVLGVDSAGATPVTIGSMAGVGSGGRVGTFASYEWHDVATGFTVTSAGYVTQIFTGIRPDPFSLGSFVFGIASNDLIGTSLPDYFAPAPGSLWETNVCSTGARPHRPSQPADTACEGYTAIPGGPVARVAADEYFSASVSVYLPAAGTYWLYTRHVADEVFSSWDVATEPATDLFATRRGSVARGSEDYLPGHRTFFQSPAGGPSLGFSVLFEPDGEVPEPPTMLLGLLALAVLTASRRFKIR